MPVITAGLKATIFSASLLTFGTYAYAPWLAGKLEQESGFNSQAHSKYAHGIAQFIPSTYRDVSSGLCKDIESIFSTPHQKTHDPGWSIMCSARYDKWIYDKIRGHAASDCSAMLMTQAAYNNGIGRLTKAYNKSGNGVWFGGAERFIYAKETKGYVINVKRRAIKYYLKWYGDLKDQSIPCINSKEF